MLQIFIWSFTLAKILNFIPLSQPKFNFNPLSRKKCWQSKMSIDRTECPRGTHTFISKSPSPGCALALAKRNLCLSSGSMVRHIAMEYPFPHIRHLLLALFKGKKTVNIECFLAMINVYCPFSFKKELITGDGCVEMDIPWKYVGP